MHIKRILFLILILLFFIAVPIFTKNTYTLHLVMLFFIASVLGMGFSMIYSTGLITLGAAAFYAIGAYSATLLTLKAGLSFWTALPLSMIITACIACIIGMIFIRASSIAFVILSMLFALTIYNLLGSVQSLGGWGGFINIPRPSPIDIPLIGKISFESRASFYYLCLFFTLFFTLSFYAIYTSRIGRAWKIIKQSPRLAQSLGINIYRYRILSFVIASTAAGTMGAFYSHYYQVIVPAMFGGFISIQLQVYAALGGLEYYILGPIVGAFIMIFVPEWLSIAQEIQPIIFGAILIIIIVFFPGGILHTFFGGVKPPTYIKIVEKIKGSFK